MSTPRKRVVGKVTLVAAGPGDIELMPLRSLRALEDADLVIADFDAIEIANRLAGARAEVVPAVDADGLPLERAARAKAVAAAAKAGRSVVRLFAGDPVLDGSFSRETSALERAGVGYEYVPGVSTISSIAGFAGIGLTNKNAVEVRVVDAGNARTNWADHIEPHVTLVVLNGADSSVQISKALVAAGRDPKTPVVITRDGATVGQRSLSSTLAELPAAAKASGHVGNGIVVIGDAASRARELSWFEARPLFGWKLLLPRTKDSVAGLVGQFERLGATVTEVATLSVEPPRTPQQMDRAIKGLVAGRFEWVAFTCVNSVQAVWAKCEEYGLDARAFAGLKIAASGSGTAEALKQFGLRPDILVEDGKSTSDLLELFPEYDELVDPLNRVFLPRADIATESLAAGLAELGWEVEDVTAYRTVRAAPPSTEIREAIKTGGFDAVVFTSSATVRNLIGIAGKPHANTAVACIGPLTAKTCEEHGLVPTVVAPEPTSESLVAAVAAHGSDLRDAALEQGESSWRPSRRRPNTRRKAN